MTAAACRWTCRMLRAFFRVRQGIYRLARVFPTFPAIGPCAAFFAVRGHCGGFCTSPALTGCPCWWCRGGVQPAPERRTKPGARATREAGRGLRGLLLGGAGGAEPAREGATGPGEQPGDKATRKGQGRHKGPAGGGACDKPHRTNDATAPGNKHRPDMRGAGRARPMTRITRSTRRQKGRGGQSMCGRSKKPTGGG